MLLKEILNVYDLLDSATANGDAVANYLKSIRASANVEVVHIDTPKGSNRCRPRACRRYKRTQRGWFRSPIGLMGWLGGIGARPGAVGYVSDGDGALVALAIAAKLLDMQNKGDRLEGDVYLATHICPCAPTRPHDPVPLMDSEPFRDQVKREAFASAEQIDALMSCDTTKGNHIINARGLRSPPPSRKATS